MNANTTWISNIHLDCIHQHKVRNLNSKHLANIIHFFKKFDQKVHGHSPEECLEIIKVMEEEAAHRELTPDFLAATPYDYDPKMYEEYNPDK